MQTLSGPGFLAWIRARHKTLFWIFLSGTCITGYLQLAQSRQLKNEAAPAGIVSLETAYSFTSDTSIIASWKAIQPAAPDNMDRQPKVSPHSLLRVAAYNIGIDYVFIVFYTLLAIVIISWLQLRSVPENMKWTRLLILLAWQAGLMDVVENTGMLTLILYMKVGGDPFFYQIAGLIKFIAAWTKFILLGGLAFIYLPWMLLIKGHGLQQLSALLSIRKEQLYRYRIIILGIAGFVLPIWVLDQGQDLLINSNAEDQGVVLFLAAVLILATLNWYLAKLFFERTPVKRVYYFYEPETASEAERRMSCFLGVATILAPAAAVLNAIKVIRLHYPLDLFSPEAWLIILLVIFYLLIKFDVARRAFAALSKRMDGEIAAGRIFLLIIFLLVFLVPLIIRLTAGAVSHTPASLQGLYWHLLSLAIAFYLFISLRLQLFPSNSWLGHAIGKLVFLMAMVCTLLFLIINIFPFIVAGSPNYYFALPFVLSGAVFYILLFTIVIRFGAKQKINYLMLLVVAGIAFSLTGSNYHRVRRTAGVPAGADSSLEAYFRGWVMQRRAALEADSAFPVFLINTYGGGIRAAAFHSIAVNWLNMQFIPASKWHRPFEYYTFSVSGASGGTIGAAVQAAYQKQYADSLHLLRPESFMGFYQYDFLSPVLVADLGRDLFAGWASLDLWDDRAVINDKAWTKIARKALNIQLDDEYTNIWRLKHDSSDYQVPLLFANTLNVDDGLKGICAPVHLKQDDFPATIFIRDLQDSLNAHRNKNEPARNVSLITGAFLSARFPYVSPSGKMGAGYHFMDGGGKDNSGAGTSELIFAALGRYADSIRNFGHGPDDSLFTHLISHIRICFVSINSSAHTKEPRKLVDNRFEPISPVVGIVNSGIDGNAHAADSTLLIRYGKNDSLRHLGFYTSYFSIFPTADTIVDSVVRNGRITTGNPYTPVLPLGWQISEPALRRLAASFETANRRSMGEHGADALLKLLRIEKTLLPASK